MNIIEVVKQINEEDHIKRNIWGNTFLKLRKDPYGGLFFVIGLNDSSYETSFTFKVEDLIANDWAILEKGVLKQ